MAQVQNLDFDGFVSKKKGERAGGPEGGGHDYAYISDNQCEIVEDPVCENLNRTQLETPDADGGTNSVAVTGPRSTAIDTPSYARDVERDGPELASLGY